MHQPKVKALVARPNWLLKIPVLGHGETNQRASDDAGDGPETEKDQKNVANALEDRERKDAPELEKECGLEEHESDVIAQR